MYDKSPHLQATLGPWMLWGLGVGYVIGGMYFGWNLGLIEGGSLGLGIAVLFVSLMYICFTLSYVELTCLFPKAGGAFVYAKECLGPNWGFVAGLAQIIEFLFAPPAIAAAIGAYFSLFFKDLYALPIAIVAYFIFTGINILGVKIAATFELIMTVLAVSGLLLFSAIIFPHITVANLVANPLPNGILGILRAVPFAIWFFLGIECLANVAEETRNPQRNIVIGFSSAMITLLLLCFLVFITSVGIDGWQNVVYPFAGAEPSDSPLPLALAHVVSKDHIFFHLLIGIGVLGLIASFHGILLAAGRATFEFGKAGLAPAMLGTVHPKFKTPAWALIANMVIGILAVSTGKTGELITMACFGALTLYIISMFALLRLRYNKREEKTSFRVPFFPYLPLIALLIASVCLLAMMFFNIGLSLLYFAFLGGSLLLHKFLTTRQMPHVQRSGIGPRD